jgi:hypothetical protein
MTLRCGSVTARTSSSSRCSSLWKPATVRAVHENLPSQCEACGSPKHPALHTHGNLALGGCRPRHSSTAISLPMMSSGAGSDADGLRVWERRLRRRCAVKHERVWKDCRHAARLQALLLPCCARSLCPIQWKCLTPPGDRVQDAGDVDVQMIRGHAFQRDVGHRIQLRKPRAESGDTHAAAPRPPACLVCSACTMACSQHSLTQLRSFPRGQPLEHVKATDEVSYVDGDAR